MGRNRFTSPTLDLNITEENRAKAIASNSGGCLIADAIKRQYPHLTSVMVDMATIRVTDKAKGIRFVYLTPPTAQHVLLSFDQEWPNPTEHVTIRRAVQAYPITVGKRRAKARAQRRAELQRRRDAGEELSRAEKNALAKAEATPDRPTTEGPVEVTGNRITGGRPITVGPAHPNLLRGRNRIFGAKLADPGQAFRDAVAAALAKPDREP